MAAAAIEKLPQLKSATDGLKEMRDPLSLPARHHSSGEPTDATQMPWRAEYAKSSRSSCKSCKSPINKETFRLGKLVQATQFADVIPMWHHASCILKKTKQIKSYINLQSSTALAELIGSRVSSFRKTGRYKLAEQRCSKEAIVLPSFVALAIQLVNGHRHPEVKWAETTDKIFLTVVLADSKETKFNLDPEGVFDFSAKAGPENHVYELKLELHGKVNVEESKINIGVRSIFCIIEKAEPERWNKLVRGGKAPHYVKIDWDKWVDEDDEGTAGAGDMDMGGMGEMDFSNLVVWPELKDLAAWEAWVVWVAWEGWVGWKSLKTVMMKNLQNQETRKMKPSRKKQNQ
ncbi:Uncharacterized protein Rs2_05458 [Raphanus sativus]|nr:Uncharacterized protein Rs2_05458 [Raphanus sativus]